MRALNLALKKSARENYQLSDREKKTGKVLEGSRVWRYSELGIEELNKPKNLNPKTC